MNPEKNETFLDLGAISKNVIPESDLACNSCSGGKEKGLSNRENGKSGCDCNRKRSLKY